MKKYLSDFRLFSLEFFRMMQFLFTYYYHMNYIILINPFFAVMIHRDPVMKRCLFYSQSIPYHSSRDILDLFPSLPAILLSHGYAYGYWSYDDSNSVRHSTRSHELLYLSLQYQVDIYLPCSNSLVLISWSQCSLWTKDNEKAISPHLIGIHH